MFKYLAKRLAYVAPIIISVNLITFCMFFILNSPDNIARAQLGGKYTDQKSIEQWQKTHGYDLPLFYNQAESGIASVEKTLFFQKTVKLILFDFGQSLDNRSISRDLLQRMGPSLAIAIPSLLLGLIFNIIFGLALLVFKSNKLGGFINALLVVMMSISIMFYIIAAQYLFSKVAQLAPISGWQSGVSSWRFIWLPVLVSVLSGLGAGGRWYFAIFAEESGKDYVLTAKAKGVSAINILFKHILPNGLIPIVTGIVAVLPLLFMGSLLLESFFGIPGLGSYVLDAINKQDFEIIRVMVFIGTLLYLIGLILTDIVYVLIDPRIRFD